MRRKSFGVDDFVKLETATDKLAQLQVYSARTTAQVESERDTLRAKFDTEHIARQAADERVRELEKRVEAANHERDGAKMMANERQTWARMSEVGPTFNAFHLSVISCKKHRLMAMETGRYACKRLLRKMCIGDNSHWNPTEGNTRRTWLRNHSITLHPMPNCNRPPTMIVELIRAGLVVERVKPHRPKCR